MTQTRAEHTPSPILNLQGSEKRRKMSNKCGRGGGKGMTLLWLLMLDNEIILQHYLKIFIFKFQVAEINSALLSRRFLTIEGVFMSLFLRFLGLKTIYIY